MRVDRKEGVGVAGTKAVRHFGKGVAVAEETILELGVVKEGEVVGDGGYFFNPGGDDVAREGYIAHWSSEQLESTVASSRDAAIERIENGCVE